MKIPQRFLSKIKVNEDTQCWEWFGANNGQGYGRAYYKGKLEQAHRIFYSIVFGKIPTDKIVLHKCDNKCCVNPNHLRLGDHSDNIQDMIAKGRDNFGGGIIPLGSLNSNAKLSEKDIGPIREMLARNIPHKVIAKKFGVARQTITNLKANTRWKHI